MMRALALLLALTGLAGTALAASPLAISGVNPQAPAVVQGQDITLVVGVSNSNTVDVVFGVSTTVQVVTSSGTGGATLVSAPTPVAKDIAAVGSANFTWVFKSTGCGQVAFTGWATGFDGASGTTTTSAAQSSGVVLISCPTVTDTPTPTPVVTATPTFTATPWVIYVNPPTTGDASIPGNIFHPGQGQSLQLKFDAPAEGEVSIDIYNRLGQRVRSLTRSVQPGSYTELWDGRSDQGLLVASGIYVAQFRGKALYKTVKFAVIK